MKSLNISLGHASVNGAAVSTFRLFPSTTCIRGAWMVSFFDLISSKLCDKDLLHFCRVFTQSLDQFRSMLTQSKQCRNRGRCHCALKIIAHDWICPIGSDVDSSVQHRFCRLFFYNSHNVASIRSLAPKVAPIRNMSATGDRREIVVVGMSSLILVPPHAYTWVY